MSTANVVAGWGMLALSVLAMVGLMFSPFVPSPLMVQLATWGAGVVGLIYAVFFWGVGGFGWSAKSDAALQGKKGAALLSVRGFRVPFMALVFFSFGWLGFGAGAPWLLNFVIGHDGQMSVVIDGWNNGSRKSCSRPTVQHVPPFMSGAQALCLDETQQRNLPPGTPVRLLGRVSVLGIAADRIEW